MLPSPAAGRLLSTPSTSSNNPPQIPSTAPLATATTAATTAITATAGTAATAATSAPATTAPSVAGVKRSAATDLQRGGSGGNNTPSKRQATAGHRTSVSGFPLISVSSTSSTPAFTGFPSHLPGANIDIDPSSPSSSSPTTSRQRHARSQSNVAPIMPVSTTAPPVMPLPQATLPATAAHRHPSHHPPPSPHRGPLPPPPNPSSAHQYPPVPVPVPVPALTADQLLGKSPDQLVATILQIQSQHQQYVAYLSTQYDNISQQLGELRASLQAFYGGQAAAHQAASAVFNPRDPLSSTSSSRQMFAPPPLSQPQPISLHNPRPSTSHSRGESSRQQPLQSPTAAPGGDQRLLPKPLSSSSAGGAPTGVATPSAPQQTPQTPGPPAYDYRTVGTVEEVWREYREGMDGQPAIEKLDEAWGSRWRPEPRGRTWYSRRKVIWDKIKEHIEAGMAEDEAVREVERLRDGGTINKLIRLLQEEKKEKGGAAGEGAAGAGADDSFNT